MKNLYFKGVFFFGLNEIICKNPLNTVPSTYEVLNNQS